MTATASMRPSTPPDPQAVLTRAADGPDVVLRHGDHPDHVVDVHLPTQPLDARTPAPLVVVLHGGFWRMEHDRRHTRPLAAALREQGYAVATPEYRRTGGDGGWPATFDDVARVRELLPALLGDALPG
ncbi:MAG: alpha/beta hydrolase, partial [Actinomycetota bacterium]|nr:alpha/beta hydrolase [Actinomycetota bacterium]